MNIELQRARKRQMFIFLLVCFGMIALLGRAYYWQVINPVVLDGYTTKQLANFEHVKNRVLDAPRGLIYDMNGQLLASNVVRDDVYIEPIQFWSDHTDSTQTMTDLSVLINKLHQILNIAEDKLYKAFNLGQGKYPLATYMIAPSINPATSQQLRASHLSYVFLEPHPVRVYPGGDLAAQILGYVGPDPDPNAATQYTGFYGIEGQYNSLLSGKPGTFTAETDLNGNPLTVGASSGQQAVNGANITLTIDSVVQYYAQQILAEQVKKTQAQSGTAIVMNARTGAIIAMANAPTFDPNNFGKSVSVKGCENQLSVYLNSALYCAYEPGSTMKSVTMAAGLDQGVITPNTTVNDPGIYYFNDAQAVTNWNDLGYGLETMTGVLEHSANVGAAFVAHDKLGASRFYPYLQQFGFGQRTGLALPNLESPGTYRSPQNAPANSLVPWTPSDLTRQAFGQSILVTPMQMVQAYQTIANGGVMMRPYLVASINDNDHVTTTQTQVKRRVISAQAAQQLISMLNAAADYNKQATFPGYSVAVKTGTATTQGISADQTVASMAGFLPASNPQYVILVKIDRPQATIFGGTAAAPVWKLLAQELMWHYSVPPDLPINPTGSSGQP